MGFQGEPARIVVLIVSCEVDPAGFERAVVDGAHKLFSLLGSHSFILFFRELWSRAINICEPW